jgi:hypothetical protein
VDVSKFFETPGVIYCEPAYAQGKMLDHSGWSGKLPRGVTPSDIDAVWDNNGDFIFAELSSSKTTWNDLSRGQVLAYSNLIHSTIDVAVLFKHSVPTDKQIDTYKDCDSFQVMWDDSGICLSKVFEGERWPRFVKSWFANPLNVRDHLRANRYEFDYTYIPF